MEDELNADIERHQREREERLERELDEMLADPMMGWPQSGSPVSNWHVFPTRLPVRRYQRASAWCLSQVLIIIAPFYSSSDAT